MAADPTLADRLDERAEPGHLPIIGYSFAADLCAAAVRLRKLDALEEAIGDVDDLRVFADDLSLIGDERDDWMDRIADALGGDE